MKKELQRFLGGVHTPVSYTHLDVYKRQLRNKTLIINLPGSPKAVRESMEIVLESVQHGLGILRGSESECAR